MKLPPRNTRTAKELRRPGVGVGVFVVNNGKVLLLRRQRSHGAGTWCLPGGHLEFGESLEDCAVRETREETGLTVRDPKFVAITNDLFGKENKHYITIFMKARYVSGTPRVNAEKEMTDVGWFPWKELPQPLFLTLTNLFAGRCYPRGAHQGIAS